MSSTLHDFTDVEPPIVREVKQIRRGETTIGYIGPSNRSENCIVSERLRYDHVGRNQHYYRKVGGYSYGKIALSLIKDAGVSRIVIDEIDNNRVLEFDVSQYESGVETGVFKGDQNVCVPVSEALYEWTHSEATILSRNGSPDERKEKYQQFE